MRLNGRRWVDGADPLFGRCDLRFGDRYGGKAAADFGWSLGRSAVRVRLLSGANFVYGAGRRVPEYWL
jgi:hypothetical protein